MLEEARELSEIEKRTSQAFAIINLFDDFYIDIIDGLGNEKRKKLMKVNKDLRLINDNIKKLKLKIPQTIKSLPEKNLESGHFYIQLLDYLSESAYNLTFMAKPSLEHVQNNHQELSPEQFKNLKEIGSEIRQLVKKVGKYAEKTDEDGMNDISVQQDKLLALIDNTEEMHLRRIKTQQISTRNSVLYIGILRETRSMVLFMNNLAKAYKKTLELSS